MKLSLELNRKVAEAVQGPVLFLLPASPSVNSLHSHCSVSKPELTFIQTTDFIPLSLIFSLSACAQRHFPEWSKPPYSIMVLYLQPGERCVRTPQFLSFHDLDTTVLVGYLCILLRLDSPDIFPFKSYFFLLSTSNIIKVILSLSCYTILGVHDGG